MKIIFLYAACMLISICCKAQNDTSYIDQQEKYHERKIAHGIVELRTVDTAYGYDTLRGYSSVSDYNTRYRMYGHPFEQVGAYAEYFDAHFDTLRLRGEYYKGFPTGYWQEYYHNGNLLCEGMCKVLIVITDYYSKEVRKDAKIWIVDQLAPEDTVCVPFSDKVIDSLSSLVQYYGVHTYNMAYSHFGDTSSSMPGVGKMCPRAVSVKVGEWDYYNEQGDLIRKEFYDGGRLLREIHY